MNKIAAIAAICSIILVSVIMGLYIADSDKSENAFALTITDDYGEKVTIPNNIQRIVSLSPSTTEILFAVGLGDKIVGIDEYSDYPEETKGITKIGSYLTPNLEIIVSLEPDLVFVSDMTSKDDVENLKEKGLTVIVLAPITIDEIIQDIRLVGVVCNNVLEVNNLTDNLDERINLVTSKTNNSNLDRPRVYIEYFPYWTYGPGSFGNDLISMAGGTNIAASTATEYPEITTEFIVASNPEIIILTIGPMTSTSVEDIITRIGWDSIDAIKNDEIFTIDDNIISRPGPRMVNALERLAEIIHPELFS